VDPLTHADHGAAQNLWVDVEDRKHLLAELAAKGSLDVALKRLVRRPGERDTGADPIVLDIEQRLDEQRELVGGGLERLAQELGLLGRYQREAVAYRELSERTRKQRDSHARLLLAACGHD